MPKNDDPALQLDRPAPPDGLPAAYSCEHGASNVPCLCHYATAMVTGEPTPKTMPNNWHEDVKPGKGGVSDKANVK